MSDTIVAPVATGPVVAEKGAAKPTGLVKARRSIQAARERGLLDSDGGSTGKSDGND
ncbi:hypothetical protein [Streptomyces radicis]|uniref:hypothetical protein n=1 Tax=Streptomyces radicis TaxID=1750517 RepID=UPI0016029700|nr:hypothetical protein [Streptomyces radicis]